jgi:hypothetical protein
MAVLVTRCPANARRDLKGHLLISRAIRLAYNNIFVGINQDGLKVDALVRQVFIVKVVADFSHVSGYIN